MQFTYALADRESDVRVESAGSLRGGRRIWTLLRTETMTVNDNDAVVPYVLCFSSHDGTSSVEFMPTSIRVVCNNTLTAARNHARGNNQRFHFRHTQGLMDRLDSAASDMRMCFTNVRAWMARCDERSRVNWSSSDVQEFFVKVYEELWSNIPSDADMALDSSLPEYADIEVPTAAKRARTRHAKAVKTVAEWSQLFDRSEEQHITASPWKAANAVTNWLDHDSRVVMRKGSTHESEGEARIHNNLFGTTAAQKAKVMKLAGCGM
jgi:phage/plasmid-like protein (TIGR03299 family)